MRYPVNVVFKVTLKWGSTSAPYSASNKHNGTDLVSSDRKIVAPEAGTITYYGDTKGKSGWMMVLQGVSGRRHSFSHTVARSNKVKVGTKVKESQHIATMGSTGYVTGVHVHWVVDGGTIDPETLVKKENKMVNEDQVYVLFRFYLGKNPTAAQMKQYNNKISFSKLQDKLIASASYKAEVAKAKAGKLDPKGHLPGSIREVYKPMPAPAPSAKQLTKGLYEVK